jgi:protease I
MTQITLSGKRIAVLTENGFEEIELTAPKKALEDAGAKVEIISPQEIQVKAWNHDHWSIELPVDVTLNDADASLYDGLLLPGGVMNPDKTRMNQNCIDFVQEFLAAGKPVAAICHAPQLLIETGWIKGKSLTSYPSLKTDLENAGAFWTDEEVVVDHGLITSRFPKDIDAFNEKFIEELTGKFAEHQV